MKNRFLSYLTLVVLGISLTNCGGGGEAPGGAVKTYNYEKADSLSVDYLKELGSVKVNIELAAQLYQTLEAKGYEFDNSLLTPSSQSFNTSKQQALGMGMFSSSLAYGAIYKQEQLITTYLSSIVDLTKKLGIPEAFDEELLKKLASTDTTVNKSILLTKAYINATDQLYSEERASLVTMMVAGGYMEGLLIATGATKVKLKDKEVGHGLYELVYSYDNTIKMLEVFKDKSPDVKAVYDAFKEVEKPIQDAIHSHGKLTLDHVHTLNAAMVNVKSKLL